ncbi:MAG TPA: hypothetical protein VGH19_09180 [Verrucomicrobiae bacterium]
MKAKAAITSLIGLLIAVNLAIYFHPQWKTRRAKQEIKYAATTWFEKEAHHYRTADPSKDAVAAAAKGDTNFYGVMGVGLSLPGITNRAILLPALQTRQYRVISRTSDVIESELHLQYVLAASDYAKAYNLALEKLILSNRLPAASNP